LQRVSSLRQGGFEPVKRFNKIAGSNFEQHVFGADPKGGRQDAWSNPPPPP